MQVIQVSTHDLGGGAEKVALDLHRAYTTAGLKATLLVGNKRSNQPGVVEIKKGRWRTFWQQLDQKLLRQPFRGSYRLHKLTMRLIDSALDRARREGKEYYNYPESKRALRRLQTPLSVLHFHNLHGRYFDLKALPELTARNTAVLTMHDEYLYTGHCAYTLDCERWQVGCGDCPHLDSYPPIAVDNTRANWEVKRAVLTRSRLQLVTPSRWLAERARASFLGKLPVCVIPNGVDLSVFSPANQQIARAALGLDARACVLLFAAAAGRGFTYKDYEMLDRVMGRLAERDMGRDVIFLAVGGSRSETKLMGRTAFIQKPFISDPRDMALCFQACDSYLHAAKAESFGLVIIEAMGCARAVVATRVGGISELVIDGVTGFTVPPGDDAGMAQRVEQLIATPALALRMGLQGRAAAEHSYSHNQMVSSYLDLYSQLLLERQA